MASQAEIARHLGVSQAVVSKLLADGVLPSRDIDACRNAYINHLREIAAGRVLDTTLTAERTRVAKEQADKLEMLNGVRRGELVEVHHVAKLVGESLARVRTRLLAIPAERAPEIHRSKTAAEVQDALMAAIVEALEDLIRPDDFEAPAPEVLAQDDDDGQVMDLINGSETRPGKALQKAKKGKAGD